MAFLIKYQRDPPPTSNAFIKEQATSIPLDPEKSHVQDNEIEHAVQSHDRHILPDIERKVVRKLDLRIVPLVTALYVLAFLDRSNIGKYVRPEHCTDCLNRILSLEAYCGGPSTHIVLQSSMKSGWRH